MKERMVTGAAAAVVKDAGRRTCILNCSLKSEKMGQLVMLYCQQTARAFIYLLTDLAQAHMQAKRAFDVRVCVSCGYECLPHASMTVYRQRVTHNQHLRLACP